MTDSEKLDLLLEKVNAMEIKVSQIDDVKKDISELKSDVTGIKIDIENVVKPNIQLLAENYVPAAKRYETESGKIENLETDVDALKKVVAGHSEKLQQLA